MRYFVSTKREQLYIIMNYNVLYSVICYKYINSRNVESSIYYEREDLLRISVTSISLQLRRLKTVFGESEITSKKCRNMQIDR